MAVSSVKCLHQAEHHPTFLEHTKKRILELFKFLTKLCVCVHVHTRGSSLFLSVVVVSP